MDTYAGNNQDPITLHKYLYANANPVSNIDPTGRFSMMSLSNNIAITGILSGVRFGLYAQTVYDIANGGFELSALSLLQEVILSKIRLSKSLIRLAEARMKWLSDFWKKGKRTNPCPFNSFDGATLVATEHGLVPIEEIKIGDMVWAYNEANQTKSLQEVTHLIRGEGTKELIDIELSTGEVIVATSNHPFWEVDSREWLEADTLAINSILLNINDKNTTIKSLTHHKELKKVYNLTVNNFHTYFVGVSGVLGHNSGCDPFGKLKGLNRNRSLADLTDGEYKKLFKKAGFRLDDHAIFRMRDARTRNLGYKTPNDIQRIWNKGYRFDAGSGDFGYHYKGMEIIITPPNLIRTVRPRR